jgi:hypothetical protein
LDGIPSLSQMKEREVNMQKCPKSSKIPLVIGDDPLPRFVRSF